MNKKETMLEVIQDKIWDKTLSEWCKVDIWCNVPYYVYIITTLQTNRYSYDQHTERKYKWIQECIEYKWNFEVDRIPILEIKKIIWHDVYIWDVLDYFEKKFFRFITAEEEYQETWNVSNWLRYWLKKEEMNSILSLMWKWEHKRKPITEQSDSCIEYIFNLIKE